MNLKYTVAAAALVGVASASTLALAGTKVGDGELSGNFALTTEYSFRGITQSDEGPAVQGGFDYEHMSGFYAGLWGSSIDFNTPGSGNTEVDLYAGYTWDVSGVGLDVGGLYYLYPNSDSNLDYDFFEVYAAASYDFDVFSASLGGNYSPENFGETGDAFYLDANVEAPVTDSVSVLGHVGRQWIDEEANFGADDYLDWSLGVNYNWAETDFTLSYVDTDVSEALCADGCDSRLIFSISRSF